MSTSKLIYAQILLFSKWSEASIYTELPHELIQGDEDCDRLSQYRLSAELSTIILCSLKFSI